MLKKLLAMVCAVFLMAVLVTGCSTDTPSDDGVVDGDSDAMSEENGEPGDRAVEASAEVEGDEDANPLVEAGVETE